MVNKASLLGASPHLKAALENDKNITNSGRKSQEVQGLHAVQFEFGRRWAQRMKLCKAMILLLMP
jgi:hypothetical protein